MRTTRVHSGRWIFDGTEFHRAAVDRSESEEGVRFHPRVDVRHIESRDCQQTYKLEPGAEDPGLPTLKQALAEAKKGRDEWERGGRSLHPVAEVEQAPQWPQARDMLKEEWNEAATRPRNEALERHGPAIDTEITEWLRGNQEGRKRPEREEQEPDMDIDR